MNEVRLNKFNVISVTLDMIQDSHFVIWPFYKGVAANIKLCCTFNYFQTKTNFRSYYLLLLLKPPEKHKSPRRFVQITLLLLRI